jgi:hypothetical protein
MRWIPAGDSLLSMREEGTICGVRSQNGANLTVLLVALRCHHLGGGAGLVEEPVGHGPQLLDQCAARSARRGAWIGRGDMGARVRGDADDSL